MATTPKDLIIAKMFQQPRMPTEQPMTDVSETGDLVKGPGTETSDEVPAAIVDKDGKPVRQAALSDGEFVVKADAVRKLGRGNPQLGSEMLNRMVAQILSQDDSKVDTPASPGIAGLLGAKPSKK